MSALRDEVDANAASFAVQWPKEISDNLKLLQPEEKVTDSYRRIAAIQALKSGLIEPSYSKPATNFYSEAQNDMLTSHVLASFGAWRSALQALRSAIENALNAFYYNDHPVEARLWECTDFKMPVSDLFSYFCRHPDIVHVSLATSGIEQLKSEYSTLSKAVHSSAPSFRMTDPAAKLLLWSPDKAKLGMWATREQKVIEGICLLTTILNRPRLSGAALPQVRAMLEFAITSAKRKKLKEMHVHVG